MKRHEEIKQQCAQILNYYYVLSRTELILNTNERIDVIGYFNNNVYSGPDIGIEVERTNDLQHDTIKLPKTGSFQLRIIVSGNYDTSPLGPIIDISGKDVYVVKRPDRDITFELKIREFTKQNNKTWFTEFMAQHKIKRKDYQL